MTVAVLLIGLTGAGKTHLARLLEERGVIRLSIDEAVHEMHGRYGVDYPEHEYFERERPAIEAVQRRMTALLRSGVDVVLDHGLWLRSDRTLWKALAEAAGATCRLVCLPVERDELVRRLRERNERDDANALRVTPEALDDFYHRFDPPGADENAILYAGDLDAIYPMRSRAATPTQLQRVRHMNLYRRYFDLVASGRKTIEVRVQYDNLRNLAAGQYILFACSTAECLTRITRIARYDSFEEMLDTEGPANVNPDSPREDTSGSLVVMAGALGDLLARSQPP